MSEPIREQLVKLLASNVGGEVGMAWFPSGDPTDKAFIYADAILAAFKVEPLSPVGETEAAKLPLDPEGDSGLTNDVLNLLVSTYDGSGIGIWVDHYAVADEKRRQTMIGSLYR